MQRRVRHLDAIALEQPVHPAQEQPLVELLADERLASRAGHPTLAALARLRRPV